MPQPFKNAVMTNGGAALLTRAQAGECKIEFTRVGIGKGVYSDDEKTLESLQMASGLKDIQASFLFSSIEVYSEYSVKLTALISNQDPATREALITTGFYINEMGIFAKEAGDEEGNTEVLYSITVTAGNQGDFMPPYNGYCPAQIIQEYYITVNNSAEITLNANVGSVALVKDLKEEKEEREQAVQNTQDMIAEPFDKAASYTESDYCIYEDVLYRFIAPHVPGEWNGAEAEATTVAWELRRLLGEDKIESVFLENFTLVNIPASDALGYSDIVESTRYQYNGETSEDEGALSSEEIDESVNYDYSGEASEDEEALSPEEILKACQ